jgi:hypothetical protein
MKPTVIYLTFLILLAGCNKDDDTIPAVGQVILFQKEYINYAWGYQQNGWVIDSSGNVRSYQLPEIWHFADSLGMISSQDMNDNIQQAGSILFKIDKDTLLHYFAKLEDAANGKLSEPRQEMFDAGITQFSGYLYQPNSKKYKQVIIRQIGDVYIENKSSEANDIYNWMVGLDPQN